MQLVTQAEFARRMEFTPQYVTKLLKTGKIERRPDKKIDLEAAMQSLQRNADPARSMVQEKSEVAGTTYQDVRTQREAANARLAEMQVAEQEGRLIDKKAVEREVFTVFRELQEKLLRVPHQCAGRLVTMTSEREIAAYLEDALGIALAETADTIERRQ